MYSSYVTPFHLVFSYWLMFLNYFQWNIIWQNRLFCMDLCSETDTLYAKLKANVAILNKNKCLHKTSFQNFFSDSLFWTHGKKKYTKDPVYSFHIFSFHVTWRPVLLCIYKRTSWTIVFSKHWFFPPPFNPGKAVLSLFFFFLSMGFAKTSFLNCKTSSKLKQRKTFLIRKSFF